MKASPIELAWSIIAGIGVLLSLWMIADAWLDYRSVVRGIRGGYARARGARWWIAVGALGGNAMLVLVWLGFLAIGVLAMQYPPPPREPDQQVSNQWAGWVLIGMEALLAATQVWARLVRLQVAGRPHLPGQGPSS